MNKPTSSARNRILSNLRRSLSKADTLFRDGDHTATTSAERPPVTQALGDQRSLAEQFGHRMEIVDGRYEFAASTAGAAERLVQVIRELQRGSSTSMEILSWPPDDLPIPNIESHLAAAGISLYVPDSLADPQQRQQAAALEVGITGVEAAFAGTGSVVFAPTPGKSRAASLLPLYHVMLIPVSRVYATVEAWLDTIRKAGLLDKFLRESSQLVFVTGPSKSADIELNLTLGVHGPKVVHAIVFDDGKET